MFTFGDYTADPNRGVTAILEHWPNLPGLDNHAVESPGRDGSFYATSSLAEAEFTFATLLEAPSPAAVLGLADELTAACDPRNGPRPLAINVAPGWRWGAILGGPLEWERVLWTPGLRCQLAAAVTFICHDPHGYAVPDETWERTTPGGLSVTRRKGNTASFPTIEIRGSLSASQTVTITVSGTSVQVRGPLTATQVLRLDYQAMDFGIWQGTTKVASVAARMNNFTRLQLPAGQTMVSVATTGALSSLRVEANSRRI